MHVLDSLTSTCLAFSDGAHYELVDLRGNSHTLISLQLLSDNGYYTDRGSWCFDGPRRKSVAT